MTTTTTTGTTMLKTGYTKSESPFGAIEILTPEGRLYAESFPDEQGEDWLLLDKEGYPVEDENGFPIFFATETAMREYVDAYHLPSAWE